MNTDKKKWYLYIVRTVDNFLYTGITTNVKRRFAEHLASPKRARFFRAHKAESVVYTQKVGTRSEALKREHAIKQLSKKEKEKIIR